MKRPSRLSSLFISSLLVFVCCALTGCYEGWKHGPGDDPGKQTKGGGGGGGDKPIGLLLLDVISQDQTAMSGWRCANVPSSLMSVRAWEIGARIEAMTTALQAVAQQVRVVRTIERSQDCGVFNEIQRRAMTPLSDLGTVTDTLRAKPAVHLRLVIWFDGVNGQTPPSLVTNFEWADGRAMRTAGFLKVFSGTDFVITGTPWSYFGFWRRMTSSQFVSPVIEQPAVDTSGEQELRDSIVTGTSQAVEWLIDQVSSL